MKSNTLPAENLRNVAKITVELEKREEILNAKEQKYQKNGRMWQENELQ